MAEEKIVTLNLRKDLIKTPRWKRSKRALKLLREKIRRIAKTEIVKIDRAVSEKIWARGVEKPPMKLRLRIRKIDEKTSEVKLV